MYPLPSSSILLFAISPGLTQTLPVKSGCERNMASSTIATTMDELPVE